MNVQVEPSSGANSDWDTIFGSLKEETQAA
jgi:hypothetical protein